jgi:hypothetical protein
MVSLLFMLMVTHPAAKAAAPPVAQSALTEGQLREVIDSYLDSFERPVTAAQWQALGPQAEPILLEIANGNGLPTRRANAVAGLSALGGSGTKALLTNFSLDEAKPLSMRLAAVRGLSRLTADNDLVTALRPVMEGAKDSRISSTAAELIAKRAPQSGCGLVRAKGKGDVRFNRALTACAGQ